MLVAVVVVQLYFALSSAQPSQDCITAYNATFPNVAITNCSNAYYALVLGIANEDQTMMVCNTDQQCNDMIQNIISTCGDEVLCFVLRGIFILTPECRLTV